MSHDHAYLGEEVQEEAEEDITQVASVLATAKDQHRETQTRPEVMNYQQVTQQLTEEVMPPTIDNEVVIGEAVDMDMAFGTYDEENNCITIYSKPQDQPREENTKDITTETAIQSIVAAAPLEPCLSPLSSLSLMESGYQSLGSPDTNLSDDLWQPTSIGEKVAFDELWTDSFSELFPSLV